MTEETSYIDEWFSRCVKEAGKDSTISEEDEARELRSALLHRQIMRRVGRFDQAINDAQVKLSVMDLNDTTAAAKIQGKIAGLRLALTILTEGLDEEIDYEYTGGQSERGQSAGPFNFDSPF